MKITSFEYHEEKQPGWNYAKIQFHSINLFVGETGSGKTRLLNTIFDIGVFVTQGTIFKGGNWEITFEGDDSNYRWKFEGQRNEMGKGTVLYEELIKTQENKDEVIIIRRSGEIRYKNALLPKLSSETCSIFLFKEEVDIAPIYQLFSRILRRSFSDEGLKILLAYSNIPQELERLLEKQKSIEFINNYELTVSAKLYFLKKYFERQYEELCSFYQSIFPVIESCKLIDASSLKENIPLDGYVPVFAIKEKHVNQFIHIQELSAGMQKVLLIMTDIIALPSSSVYLIDEYENSLGINAIDFLPSFLDDYGNDKQFIITTHHPYLINNMPIANWQIFHREGSNVTIKNGSEYVEKFGKSKQKAFIQLINDPFYTKGL